MLAEGLFSSNTNTLYKEHYKQFIQVTLLRFLKLTSEIEWKKEWFAYTQKNENKHRKFLDLFAKQFNIEKPSDWGKITALQVKLEPGASFLHNKYKGSLFRALQHLYPGISVSLAKGNDKETQWKRSWFSSLPEYPKNYWNSICNRKKFFDELSSNYQIVNPSDWKRVSMSLIRKRGGKAVLSSS